MGDEVGGYSSGTSSKRSVRSVLLAHAQGALRLVHQRRVVVRARVVTTTEGVADFLRVRFLALRLHTARSVVHLSVELVAKVLRRRLLGVGLRPE